eukprot:GHVT01102239.1.p1 GENE.GHVT01102239.1~~GHVT01102239.1.p1  ORF type:complete len:659 (+),score=82.18 GHVT01102239.1:444-2420(+)
MTEKAPTAPHTDTSVESIASPAVPPSSNDLVPSETQLRHGEKSSNDFDATANGGVDNLEYKAVAEEEGVSVKKAATDRQENLCGGVTTSSKMLPSHAESTRKENECLSSTRSIESRKRVSSSRIGFCRWPRSWLEWIPTRATWSALNSNASAPGGHYLFTYDALMCPYELYAFCRILPLSSAPATIEGFSLCYNRRGLPFCSRAFAHITMVDRVHREAPHPPSRPLVGDRSAEGSASVIADAAETAAENDVAASNQKMLKKPIDNSPPRHDVDEKPQAHSTSCFSPASGPTPSSSLIGSRAPQKSGLALLADSTRPQVFGVVHEVHRSSLQHLVMYLHKLGGELALIPVRPRRLIHCQKGADQAGSCSSDSSNSSSITSSNSELDENQLDGGNYDLGPPLPALCVVATPKQVLFHMQAQQQQQQHLTKEQLPESSSELRTTEQRPIHQSCRPRQRKREVSKDAKNSQVTNSSKSVSFPMNTCLADAQGDKALTGTSESSICRPSSSCVPRDCGSPTSTSSLSSSIGGDPPDRFRPSDWYLSQLSHIARRGGLPGWYVDQSFSLASQPHQRLATLTDVPLFLIFRFSLAALTVLHLEEISWSAVDALWHLDLNKSADDTPKTTANDVSSRALLRFANGLIVALFVTCLFAYAILTATAQ